MNKNLKIITIIFIALIILMTIFWFFTRETQKNLPYRITGKEYLEIQERCKNLAEEKDLQWDDSFIRQDLVGYGYSEYRGYCYAEFLRYFDDFTSKVLYDTTNEKEVFQREWPFDSWWYDSDFDSLVLGKNRIFDWRVFIGNQERNKRLKELTD